MKRSLPALALLIGAAAPAAAQQRPAARPDAPPRCENGRVAVVFVDNHSIFDTGDPDLDERFAWAYRVANALHVRTREDVIRRELLVRPGDCYDPAVLEDTERLLRAYDFLSHVDIFGIPQPDSTVHVIVDTRDEWSTRVDFRVRMDDGLDFDGVRLREVNLLGTGRAVELFYLERDANRDYGIAYEAPQLLGSRWDLRLGAGRTRAGTSLSQALGYPFVGESGRWAARQRFHRQDRFYDYLAVGGAGETHLLLPVRDKGFDFGFVHRLGDIGHYTTLGAGIGFTELRYPGGPGAIRRVRGDDFGDRETPDSAAVASILAQMEEVRTLRLLFLVGKRDIRWVKRHGLDSMRGDQDVRLGTEAELALGRSLPGRSDDQNVFATLDFYGGAEAGDVLVGTRLRAAGRRDLDAPAGDAGWKDLFADAELIAYWKPSEDSHHTLTFRAAGAGGWETRTPFQLTLGGDLGVRGYPRERFPGGRRALFTLEDRIYFGWPFRDVLDFGGTVFLDAGRVWPGDAPFGTDSGWRAAAGLGLRATLPAGGRTTYRLDVAFPLEDGASWRDLRLIVSIGELLGLSSDARAVRLVEARQLGIPGELLHFPR
ncbi:MAG TPA: BamA/TamA family outer membrane protein [Longimicrobiales bacterium]